MLNSQITMFDSLVHATPDGRWLGGSRYDASVERLLREMDRAGVGRACLVAIADFVDSAFVTRMSQQYPGRFVPVGSVNPRRMQDCNAATRAVIELKHQGFAGVKLHPRLNGYDPLDERCLATIRAASECNLVVLLDTLFRQKGRATPGVPDVIDRIANECSDSRIVLLHAGGSAALDLFEMGRMHEHLTIDLSFTLLRYAGSSLDLDIRFLCENLDQRVTVGSDFPEYVPSQVRDRVAQLCEGLAQEKLENILHNNLDRLFPLP